MIYIYIYIFFFFFDNQSLNKYFLLYYINILYDIYIYIFYDDYNYKLIILIIKYCFS